MAVEIRSRTIGAALALVAAMTLGGCAAAEPAPSPQDASSPSGETSAAGAPTLQSLIDAAPESPRFELVDETTDVDGDPAEVVSYRSGGLRLQAVVRRPPAGVTGSPAVVLLHGDADPDEYSGLTVYDGVADDLVEAGYVVVTPDLRNHGDSDDDPMWETDMDVGVTLDAINAVRAIAADPTIDPRRVAIVGHSHGGQLALNAALTAPDLTAVVVAVAPSHTSPWENITHFAQGTPYFDRVVAAHGTPDESPAYWRDVSALTYIDRATAPLLLVHGEADEVVPLEWSEDLAASWTDAGKDVTLIRIPGGDHLFDAGYDDMIAAITSYLAERMG